MRLIGLKKLMDNFFNQTIMYDENSCIVRIIIGCLFGLFPNVLLNVDLDIIKLPHLNVSFSEERI